MTMDGSAPLMQQTMGVQDVMAQVPQQMFTSPKLVIKQHVSVLEGAAGTFCSSCACCCEQPNVYDIFDSQSGVKVLTATEESDFCCRVCCQPNHKLQMHLRTPETQQVVATVDRPFKLGGMCPAWCGCCQAEASLYAGTQVATDETPGVLIGRTQQPVCGGFFTPTVHAAVGDADPADNFFAKVEGPTCIFGGLTELCCDQEFTVSSKGDKEADIGKIVKEKPQDLKAGIAELTTDADLFTMSFTQQMTPEQRMTMLSSLLLMDYMFFESNSAFECNPLTQSCAVTCCNVYCCGAIRPCKCKVGGGNDEN